MRKILCIILITSLLSYNICVYSESNQEVIEQDPKTLEELRKEAEEINKQIVENYEALELVTDELSQNLIQIQETDIKIQTSEQELNQLNDEIKDLNKNIEVAEKDLEVKQTQYQKINRKAEQILVAMYEKGNMQYLDVLLGSKNIIDFISNYFLVSELLEYNINLLQEATRQKEQVQEIAQNLNNQKQEIVAKKKQQQKISQVLENTKTSKEYYMSKLTEQEKEVQAQIEEYKIQMATVEIEIRKLSVAQSFGEDYIGGDMIWPIPGHTRITSQYGMRTHPITGLYGLHTGTDVGAPIGTDFIAMASGVVVKAGYNKYYGNMVVLDHGGGVQTLYAHGSEILVQLGELIAVGDSVLKVGSTGYSTGPHAHFEIRIKGKTVDPLNYVKPE